MNADLDVDRAGAGDRRVYGRVGALDVECAVVLECAPAGDTDRAGSPLIDRSMFTNVESFAIVMLSVDPATTSEKSPSCTTPFSVTVPRMFRSATGNCCSARGTIANVP